MNYEIYDKSFIPQQNLHKCSHLLEVMHAGENFVCYHESFPTDGDGDWLQVLNIGLMFLRRGY